MKTAAAGGESIFNFTFLIFNYSAGAVAQLGERYVRNVQVGSSNLLGSTKDGCARWGASGAL